MQHPRVIAEPSARGQARLLASESGRWLSRSAARLGLPLDGDPREARGFVDDLVFGAAIDCRDQEPKVVRRQGFGRLRRRMMQRVIADSVAPVVAPTSRHPRPRSRLWLRPRRWRSGRTSRLSGRRDRPRSWQAWSGCRRLQSAKAAILPTVMVDPVTELYLRDRTSGSEIIDRQTFQISFDVDGRRQRPAPAESAGRPRNPPPEARGGELVLLDGLDGGLKAIGERLRQLASCSAQWGIW